MEKRKIVFNAQNILSYILGFFILGFAVVSLLRSNLGAGAWDTTTFSLHAFMTQLIPFFTLGMASMMISLTIMTIVIISRKQWYLLFMLLPILLVAISIDFWDLVVYRDFKAIGIERVVLFVVGTITLPLGLSLIVLSQFPAFVFDELMLLIMDVLKTKKLGLVRLGIEILGVLLALVFGFLSDAIFGTDIGFGKVNLGTVFLAFALGPIMSFYIRSLKPYYQNN
ncbi:MAG: hypothetical protein UMR38_00325 [Candidatus Izemoplasma sp.]|nr:hypothetical protein [Candidatus Izemoplasma sp.]